MDVIDGKWGQFCLSERQGWWKNKSEKSWKKQDACWYELDQELPKHTHHS